MGQSADKVVRRLQVAQQEGGGPVRIRLKRPWRPDPLYGYVLAQTKQWVVVHKLLEGFSLDDVVLVRSKDIKRVKPHPIQGLVNRAVQGLGVPVAIFDFPSEAATRELLSRIAERDELVMLYYRDEGWEWREVVTIRRVGSERLEVHAIGEDGKWYEESGLRVLDKIVRIEFGGRYITGLQRFGEKLPTHDPESMIGKIRL